jgi:adenine-specific DNA methylase
VSLENHFDPVFAARLALREKQIQQNYRPVIGIHKWFARRPGTLFRNLLLAEYNGSEVLEESFWHAHQLNGVIADPFMGGGTPLLEANRLGCAVVGADVNPMAYWIVKQSLSPLDIPEFLAAADSVCTEVASSIAALYETRCLDCGQPATVKYFLWVKTEICPHCSKTVDLFPGYLLAEAVRHPKHVLVCRACGTLNEYDQQPTVLSPAKCRQCDEIVVVEGPARRQRVTCPHCSTEIRFANGKTRNEAPKHRMWAIEYHCAACRRDHAGRFFKAPDADDLERFAKASASCAERNDLPIPKDEIPPGDETDRLHRWGYSWYREMFNDRQLLGLGLLLIAIRKLPNGPVRNALLTVFSDSLRYQNMLCRYDTYALKCQDIFSVHGFPVGLVQCENNLLGIPRIGSGSFRHFVEKYRRAKEYCQRPFETQNKGSRKIVTYIEGEKIGADVVCAFPESQKREAWLMAGTATAVKLKPGTLDGIFTDPPYFANVQYAELMDFCYVWLRLGIADEEPAFRASSTRNTNELTGNETLGRDLLHFTKGLAEIFRHYSQALKENAPLVFTYHHNDPGAYVPIIVGILDAGLDCSATLPAVAEMSASLHILGTVSSVLDTVFVCRAGVRGNALDLNTELRRDARNMRLAGVRVSKGDLRCLLAGHFARLAVNGLRDEWRTEGTILEKMKKTQSFLAELTVKSAPEAVVKEILAELAHDEENETKSLAAAV